MSNTASSPCISVCLLNDRDICVGCYRSAREIADWGDYSEAEKKAVLQRTAVRLAAEQPIQLK